MKTNQIMLRPMGDFKVAQRTKDGYFDFNTLLESVNYIEDKNIRYNEFLRLSSVQNEVKSLNEYYNINSICIEKGKNTNYGKERDCIWMHPELFLSCCLLVSPKLKYQIYSTINVNDLFTKENNFKEIKKREQNLYLIHDSFTKEVKIGKSFNTNRRIKELSLSSKGKLTLLFDINEAGYLEFKIHDEFKHLRKRGEWFTYDESIIKRFNDLKIEFKEKHYKL
nr:GIY-YIG nuclease family protein [uncultured Flavobacterium sp.]